MESRLRIQDEGGDAHGRFKNEAERPKHFDRGRYSPHSKILLPKISATGQRGTRCEQGEAAARPRTARDDVPTVNISGNAETALPDRPLSRLHSAPMERCSQRLKVLVKLVQRRMKRQRVATPRSRTLCVGHTF